MTDATRPICDACKRGQHDACILAGWGNGVDLSDLPPLDDPRFQCDCPGCLNQTEVVEPSALPGGRAPAALSDPSVCPSCVECELCGASRLDADREARRLRAVIEYCEKALAEVVRRSHNRYIEPEVVGVRFALKRALGPSRVRQCEGCSMAMNAMTARNGAEFCRRCEAIIDRGVKDAALGMGQQ